VAHRPNPLADRPAFESVQTKTSWTRVYKRRERLCQWRKLVEAKLIGRPATWLGQPAGHVTKLTGYNLVSYHLGQVGGAPPWPYKYPTTGESRHTHTPHFEDSNCKAPILSVVARCSLVERVARLYGPEGLPTCQRPSS
jgi:hypothetical protein